MTGAPGRRFFFARTKIFTPKNPATEHRRSTALLAGGSGDSCQLLNGSAGALGDAGQSGGNRHLISNHNEDAFSSYLAG
jgi:hypothetical protein